MEYEVEMSASNEAFHSYKYYYQFYLFTHYLFCCITFVVVCLLLTYYIYLKVLQNVLERTNIPKLYKITIIHSLWMGSLHLISSVVCFSQLSTLVRPVISMQTVQWHIMDEILYAATAKFCQNQNRSSSHESCHNLELNENISEWTVYHAASLIFISAILVQELLLASRNKMDYIFFSRMFALIFLHAAIRTSCPVLSIQGMYLISVNIASTEIARTLVAWNSYSQEDTDFRPSLVMKIIAFLAFLVQMLIWLSLMLFYMPRYLHQLPPMNTYDQKLFLAYTYLSYLAYVVLEVSATPLWTAARCLGWCRRSSGMFWRTLAVSDCYLLGHYSPLILELYRIQVGLDQTKALFRNRMMRKHLSAVEEKKKRSSGSNENRPPNLIAVVKTWAALKKKMQRRAESRPVRPDMSVERLPHVVMKVEDSSIEDLKNENNDTVTIFRSEHEGEDMPRMSPDEIPGSVDVAEGNMRRISRYIPATVDVAGDMQRISADILVTDDVADVRGISQDTSATVDVVERNMWIISADIPVTDDVAGDARRISPDISATVDIAEGVRRISPDTPGTVEVAEDDVLKISPDIPSTVEVAENPNSLEDGVTEDSTTENEQNRRKPVDKNSRC